jgi:hypothetical protein
MDDQTFLAFITNNAPACEVETLRKAVDEINENIASRLFGRPSGTEIGSHVEAVDFSGTWYRYGTVVQLSEEETHHGDTGTRPRVANQSGSA